VSVRLSYADVNKNGTIEPATEILEENNYYPFGLKHKGYNEITNTNRSEAAEKYKFGGKELNNELGLDLYDFGARNYDAAIGRWLNVDPLAENSRRWTPYNYAYNNPIFFVDPDGMQASPIYGLDGKYLGNDSEGFTGEAIFMDQNIFYREGGTNNLNVNAKGTISHKDALNFGRTLDQVITDDPKKNFSQKDIDMVNGAITHIVSQMESEITDILKGLHNGMTSAFYGDTDGAQKFWGQIANDGNSWPDLDSFGAVGWFSRKENKFTVHLSNGLWEKPHQFTVPNIQNHAVHELLGHAKLGISGQGRAHAAAYDLQINHYTWLNTTKEYQEETLGGRERQLRKTY